MSDLVGRTLGEYRILEKIGEGGMAVVYRAVQISLDREVAIKFLPRSSLRDKTFIERFDREVKIISNLQHPHILDVYDSGIVEGQPYVSMAYIETGTLDDRIKQYGPTMPLDEIARYVSESADALGFAHSRGIVHRDYKPSNVLINDQGQTRLADFGIARVLEGTSHITGSSLIGTPAYMAPEMTKPGRISPLIDVYALAVTLYQLVTGSLPYQRSNPIHVLVAHVNAPIPDARYHRVDLPDAVQAVIEKGMTKDPANRYQNTRELAAELGEAVRSNIRSGPIGHVGQTPTSATLSGTPILTEPVVSGPPIEKSRSWLPWIIGAVLASVILVGVGVLSFMARNEQVGTASIDRGSTSEPEATRIAPLPEPGEVSTGSFAPMATFTSIPSPTQPVLAQVRARLGRGSIEALAYSPDGDLLAVGGGRGIYLYRTATFEEVWMVETDAVVNDIAFSPNGSQIVSGSEDKMTIVWDTLTGEKIFEFAGVLYHQSGITSVTFSPDGRTVASAPCAGPIVLWDAQQGTQVLSIEAELACPGSLTISSDGNMIAAGTYDPETYDGTVHVWDAATGELLNTFSVPFEFVPHVLFSPSDLVLAAASSYSENILLWDMATGQQLHTLTSESQVGALEFSPDGSRLASGGRGVIILDIATGRQLNTLGDKSVTSIAFAPDGLTIVAGSSRSDVVEEWNVETGEVIRTLDGHSNTVLDLAISPDGAMLASGTLGGTLDLWDISTGNHLLTLISEKSIGYAQSLGGLTFSPDGTTLAVVEPGRSWPTVWEIATGQLLDKLQKQAGASRGLLYSPDGNLLVGASGNTISVWNAKTGEPLGILDDHENWITDITFSPDSVYLAAGSESGTVIVWDMSTGDLVHKLEGHTEDIYDLIFSEDGKRLFSGSEDSWMITWDMETGGQLGRLAGAGGWVECLAISPEGDIIATGGPTITLWDGSTGDKLVTLEGHGDSISSLVFSPDGRVLVSGSEDGTIILWEITLNE